MPTRSESMFLARLEDNLYTMSHINLRRSNMTGHISCTDEIDWPSVNQGSSSRMCQGGSGSAGSGLAPRLRDQNESVQLGK